MLQFSSSLYDAVLYLTYKALKVRTTDELTLTSKEATESNKRVHPEIRLERLAKTAACCGRVNVRSGCKDCRHHVLRTSRWPSSMALLGLPEENIVLTSQCLYAFNARHTE
jgi:hypothetical protein